MLGCIRASIILARQIDTAEVLIGTKRNIRNVSARVRPREVERIRAAVEHPHQPGEIPSDERLHRVMSAMKAGSRSFDLAMAEAEAKTVAEDGRGVPVRVLRRDIDEVFERARVVRNTVEPDPDMPSIEEVRALLDEPLEGEAEQQPTAQE